MFSSQTVELWVKDRNLGFHTVSFTKGSGRSTVTITAGPEKVSVSTDDFLEMVRTLFPDLKGD